MIKVDVKTFKYAAIQGLLLFIVFALSLFGLESTSASNAGFILKHSVGSLPHNSEIDVPLIYADYYFLEALLRYKKLK